MSGQQRSSAQHRPLPCFRMDSNRSSLLYRLHVCFPAGERCVRIGREDQCEARPIIEHHKVRLKRQRLEAHAKELAAAEAAAAKANSTSTAAGGKSASARRSASPPPSVSDQRHSATSFLSSAAATAVANADWSAVQPLSTPVFDFPGSTGCGSINLNQPHLGAAAAAAPMLPPVQPFLTPMAGDLASIGTGSIIAPQLLTPALPQLLSLHTPMQLPFNLHSQASAEMPADRWFDAPMSSNASLPRAAALPAAVGNAAGDIPGSFMRSLPPQQFADAATADPHPIQGRLVPHNFAAGPVAPAGGRQLMRLRYDQTAYERLRWLLDQQKLSVPRVQQLFVHMSELMSEDDFRAAAVQMPCPIYTSTVAPGMKERLQSRLPFMPRPLHPSHPSELLMHYDWQQSPDECVNDDHEVSSVMAVAMARKLAGMELHSKPQQSALATMQFSVLNPSARYNPSTNFAPLASDDPPSWSHVEKQLHAPHCPHARSQAPHRHQQQQQLPMHSCGASSVSSESPLPSISAPSCACPFVTERRMIVQVSSLSNRAHMLQRRSWIAGCQ